MPTNRPFLSNFLAAFRAHSAIQQGKATSSPSTSTTSSQPHTSSSHPSTTASNPRTITTSTTSKPGATTTALTALHSPRTHSTSPLSRSPGSPDIASNLGSAVGSPTTSGSAGPRYITTRGRRGSDSSTEGFRDVLGKEKWYIGGRTATGEERYFKLGVIKRQRSGGSLSLDRLSL